MGERTSMSQQLGYSDIETLTDNVVPKPIRFPGLLDLPEGVSSSEASVEIRAIANQNKLWRSLIGQGYYDTITPVAIQRNIFENPAWYTAYTPYQPEISQGRLEALFNYQTLITELTGLPVANASLLDEATAAAEAASMCYASFRGKRNTLMVADHCHPQTIKILQNRGLPLGWNIIVDSLESLQPSEDCFGLVAQYPDTFGELTDLAPIAARVQGAGVKFIVATDLLALMLLKPPAEYGADIILGSAQRFGVPLGYGGPHAAFISVKDELKRLLPGRLVGMSKDSCGGPALRLALQTREQHIRRDKATSNICTAQVLLAVMASMYAIYHGPDRLKAIAREIAEQTSKLKALIANAGLETVNAQAFDTVTLKTNPKQQSAIKSRAEAAEINLRYFNCGWVGISLDEKTTEAEVLQVAAIITGKETDPAKEVETLLLFDEAQLRTEPFLTQEIFTKYHTGTEFMRYVRRLGTKDLTLANAMIPLGSCTMKLNAATELAPVSWPEFHNIHPFVPKSQAQGYRTMIRQLEDWLAEITGFAAISLQPNAGSQGEYAGLLAIRGYHQSRNEENRNICLIPESAHGTNPASAVMAGFKVVVVKCIDGGIDIDDLCAKAEKHAENLGALMVTYPSTYGVFEKQIQDFCEIVHTHGGQVYLDGANMNAMVGLCRPGDFGADVCHLNLHKTFCIPHGGGGPGVGPVAVAAHLAPFIHGCTANESDEDSLQVSAAPYGSASILPISWMYIRMMGPEGLKLASQSAILNANYIVDRLRGAFDILYTGDKNLCAHEGILDPRPLKKSAGIEVDDIAKRLMDFGFHAPTMSWPVIGTLMVEPTESESLFELDRFCDAMLVIRDEIREIEEGKIDPQANPLKQAPHPVSVVTADEWERPYPRSQAAYPKGVDLETKFWPSIGRVDHVFGDKNLVCTCPSVEEIAKECSIEGSELGS